MIEILKKKEEGKKHWLKHKLKNSNSTGESLGDQKQNTA